jgi:hypothetical protein
VLTAANMIAHHNFVLYKIGAGDHTITAKPTDQIVLRLPIIYCFRSAWNFASIAPWQR